MAVTPNTLELRESRIRREIGRNVIQETRFYRVDGFPPDTALINAQTDTGPLPEKGDLLPNDNGLDEGHTKGVQLRDISVDHYRGQLNTSLVKLFYSTGPNVGGLDTETQKKTIWVVQPSVEFETIFFDLSVPPRPIPGGAMRRTPIISSTAILDGAIVNFNMLSFQGKVNDLVFHGWDTGEIMYVGASSELIHGYDTENLTLDGNSLAKISLHFLSRIGGWQHRVPDTDASNTPTGTFTEFITHELADLTQLWVNTGFSHGPTPP